MVLQREFQAIVLAFLSATYQACFLSKNKKPQECDFILFISKQQKVNHEKI